MLEDTQRLPRSLSESKKWTPDWRDRQAAAYLAAFRDRFAPRAGEGARERFERALRAGAIRYPDWEDDPVVRARFRHMAGAAVPGSEWTAAFDLGEQLISMNPATLEVASIKAWLLVNRTDEWIAARTPLAPFQVTVLHDVWFDVRGSLLWPEDRLRVICGTPPAADAAGWVRNERRLLWAAIACGAEVVDRLLDRNEEIPDRELEGLARTRRRLVAEIYPNGGRREGRGGRLVRLG